MKSPDSSITCFVRSEDLLNTLPFHMHQTNGHQTCQSGDSRYGVSTHNLLQPFKHKLTRDHVTN